MKKTLKAYKNTAINWGKSQADIMKLLEKYDIRETRFTNINYTTALGAGLEMEKGTVAVMLEFFKTTQVSTGLGGRIPIKIIIPNIPDDDKSKNQAFRIFYWYLKTKFEAVDSGLVEFEEEFMPHIALGKASPFGNMYQAFKQNILPRIIGGESADISLLEGPKR